MPNELEHQLLGDDEVAGVLLGPFLLLFSSVISQTEAAIDTVDETDYSRERSRGVGDLERSGKFSRCSKSISRWISKFG